MSQRQLLLHRLCESVYFREVRVLHEERLPATGPVLYLGLHRNGAVDGFLYHTLLPRANFLIASQLTRSAFGRLFFGGCIEVARAKDGRNGPSGEEAISRSVEHLRGGGELVVFPEGTSSLGPSPLPFHRGAARIIAECMTAGIRIAVVPLGIFYDAPTRFRSGAGIVVGDPIDTDLAESLEGPERVNALHTRIEASLERLFEEARSFEVSSASRPAIATLLGLGPVVLAGALANAVPLLAGWGAARRLADGPNVISLWKILVGVPVFVLWAVGVLATSMLLGHAAWAALYLAFTHLGLASYHRVREAASSLLHARPRQEALPHA